jgi:hypothetical protein
MKGGELMVLKDLKHTWAIAAIVSTVFVASAFAARWDERSVLTFSESVRVPGVTLSPGTYVFELADPDSSPHVIRIRNEKTSDVVATLQAVPVKRNEASGDMVLRFDPSTWGAPVALKAWFYPNSLYGHQFVYDNDEARSIANRTKSIVLTIDKPGKDASGGRLMVYDASGVKSIYRPDETVTREWAEWQDHREASAPVIRAETSGLRVSVDDLEDNAQRYIGQRVTVDTAVEDVYGPRLFTIDEPHWGDLEGEIFVQVPNAQALSIRDDDRVTVTGTVRRFVLAELQREWGWVDLDPDVLSKIQKRPMLIADRMVGGNNESVFVIDSKTTRADNVPSAKAPITNMKTIVDDEEELIGRRVQLSDMQVASTGTHGGFFARKDGQNLFVLTSEGSRAVQAGDTVSVKGVVLQTPKSMDLDFQTSGASTDDIYVFATMVS